MQMMKTTSYSHYLNSKHSIIYRPPVLFLFSFVNLLSFRYQLIHEMKTFTAYSLVNPVIFWFFSTLAVTWKVWNLGKELFPAEIFHILSFSDFLMGEEENAYLKLGEGGGLS